VLIKQAADAACGTSDNDIDVIYRRGSNACVKDTIADAVRRINSPQLSQLYIEKYGVDRAAKYGIDTSIRTANR
jgi:S-adenosylmethionine synthetase